jgi:hypothetical protein
MVVTPKDITVDDAGAEVMFDYGNEHNPVSSKGHVVLRLTADGGVSLTQELRGRRRAWHGRQHDGLWQTVQALLLAAGFPEQPRSQVPGRADAPGFSLTRTSAAGVQTVEFPTGGGFPEYTELRRIFLTIVDQSSPGILGFRMTPGPLLVDGVVAEVGEG